MPQTAAYGKMNVIFTVTRTSGAALKAVGLGLRNNTAIDRELKSVYVIRVRMSNVVRTRERVCVDGSTDGKGNLPHD